MQTRDRNRAEVPTNDPDDLSEGGNFFLGLMISIIMVLVASGVGVLLFSLF